MTLNNVKKHTTDPTGKPTMFAMKGYFHFEFVVSKHDFHIWHKHYLGLGFDFGKGQGHGGPREVCQFFIQCDI